ncbi:glycerol uptake facilitator GlpF [Salmonella enterica subsp. enterica]|nr:glycerol uptake facilitator GlpF [Salmonella enterica subsp. enterica] [Salmonella enterica subsp. enterica serovar Menston]
MEVVITSILMGMIMALTDDGNGIPKGPLAPLLIGILVAVIGGVYWTLTGFAMNPARDFGPKLFTWLAGVGEHGDERWARDPLFYRADCRGLLSAACAGAAIYRYFIGKNLPCNRCEL